MILPEEPEYRHFDDYAEQKQQGVLINKPLLLESHIVYDQEGDHKRSGKGDYVGEDNQCPAETQQHGRWCCGL